MDRRAGAPFPAPATRTTLAAIGSVGCYLRSIFSFAAVATMPAFRKNCDLSVPRVDVINICPISPLWSDRQDE